MPAGSVRTGISGSVAVVPLLRQLPTPTGLRHGDHVCWPFSGTADLAAAVVPFLVEGCQRDEELLLVGRDEAELLSLLAAWSERDRLLSDGQLVLRTTDDVYRATGGLDPDGQVAFFRDEAERARQRGWTGLRVAADLTAAVSGEDGDRARLHGYELRVDELMATAPLTGMCLYDATVGAPELGPLAVLHAVRRADDGVPLVHLSGRGAALSLHGELDVGSAAQLCRVLVATAREVADDVLVLDLAGLSFLDVAGARALVGAGDALGAAGIRLRLARPQRLPARVLALFGHAVGDDVAEGAA